MESDALEKLVEQKIAAGEATPEWIMASAMLRLWSVLRSIDERLRTIDLALAPDTRGSSIAGELRSVSELLREVVVEKIRKPGWENR
jgi:hypothetical protein